MNPRTLIKGLSGCLLFLAGTALCSDKSAGAEDNGNPYSVIVERNIFHLNPIPPPPEPEKPKVDLPVVKITGIINIGDQKKVLFTSQPKDKKEPPAYCSLSEGERSDQCKLELVKIHPAEDAVDVINAGVPVTLTLKDDAMAPTVAAAPPPTSPQPGQGQPGNNPVMPGRPMFRPPGMPMPGGGQNGFSFPTRARRNLPQ